MTFFRYVSLCIERCRLFVRTMARL